MLQQVEQELQDQQVTDVTDGVDNGFVLEQRYREQKNNPSRNVVNELDNNFDASGQMDQKFAGKVPGFNYKWFEQNRLSNDEAKKTVENNRVQSLAKKKAPASGKPDSQLKESFGRLNEKAQRQSEQMQAAPAGENQQRRGELAQQLELYQQKLESREALRSRSNSANVAGAAGIQSAIPQAADGVQDFRNLSGLAAGRVQAPGQGQPAGQMGGGGGGFGGGLEGRFMAGLPQVDGVPIQEVVTGLTSLDVEFPQRGREYFFTTPRGDIEVTAQPIHSNQLNRATGILTILAGLLVAWIVWQVGRLVVRRLQGRPLAALLILFGGISLCSGFFPVAGGIATLTGIWMFVRSFMASPATAQVTA